MATTLTDALRAVIRESGISLYKLHQSSGVSPAVLSRFLRGQRTITVAVAERILTALRCGVSIGLPEPATQPVPEPTGQQHSKGRKSKGTSNPTRSRGGSRRSSEKNKGDGRPSSA